MNCLECQELLQNRLDGERITAPEALDQHLSDCATCRQQHAGLARLLECAKQLPTPKLPANFAAQVVHEVMRDRRHRQDKMRRRVFVTAALAAGILLMLLAAYRWIPRDLQQPPIVENRPSNRIPEKKALPTPQKNEPKNAFASFAERLADTTRDHAKVVQVAIHFDAVEKLPSVKEIPMLEPGVREASQEVTEGVRAVTHNARKAFDFFARELPTPELGEQKN
ncbi:MAG: hypothetical protein EXR98_03640 [Gemmataceae bacterium]|nr:hypothetical protein [Gemmataceae bacterium]